MKIKLKGLDNVEKSLSYLTPEQRKRFGKALRKTLIAQKVALESEHELGKLVANDMHKMEKEKDRDGLFQLSRALNNLFVSQFVYQAIHRIDTDKLARETKKRQVSTDSLCGIWSKLPKKVMKELMEKSYP